jgi:hypothetical protein
MLISRCAWHPFFRGYPRPLRVVSWRGPGVAFTDTICRSCAQRVRIEGLWASSPPTPVWPGSAQTAALFVGLPLLMALVLMATPLHDTAPPPVREDAAVTASADRPAKALAEPTVENPRDVELAASPSFRARHALARRASAPPVPEVIYESRWIVSARRAGRAEATAPTNGAAPAQAAPGTHLSWLKRALARECNCAVTLATSAAGTGARGEIMTADAGRGRTESP